MSANCKKCQRSIRWAALGGTSLPFEPIPAGAGAFQLYLAHGTCRAKNHPGTGHSNVPAYRIHRCGKDHQ